MPASGPTAVAPAFDSGWESTGGADRLRMHTAKQSTALATKTASIPGFTASDALVRQYVSDPLNAGSISGTVKAIIQAKEGSASLDQRAQLVIRVVSNDGATVRGTLLAMDTGALANEFSATALTNRRFPKGSSGATLSAVSAQAGDRIVVEVGYRQHASLFSSFYAVLFGYGWGQLRFGDTGADLAENETDTGAGSPWLEFSQTLSFQAGGAPDPPPEPPPTSEGGPLTQARVTVPWQVFLCDLAGVKLADLTTVCTGRQLSYDLNAPASFAGTVDALLVKTLHSDGKPLLAAGCRAVKGYRLEDGVYVIRFAGVVETVVDNGDDQAATCRFTAYDPLHRLGRRLCRDASGGFKTVTFVNEEGAQIARTLVDRANALGTTRLTTAGGTFEATSPRSVKWEAKMIRPALQELAQSFNGFDLAVDPVDDPAVLARLSCYVKRGTDVPDAVFAWKQEPATASDVQRVEDAAQLANAIVAVGGTTANDAKIYTAERTDSGSITAYDRQEAVVTYSDVSDADYLEDLADEHLAARKQPKYVHTMTPLPGMAPEPFTQWFLGDTVRSRAHAALRGGFSGTQRVYGFVVDLDDEAGERVTAVKVGLDS